MQPPRDASENAAVFLPNLKAASLGRPFSINRPSFRGHCARRADTHARNDPLSRPLLSLLPHPGKS